MGNQVSLMRREYIGGALVAAITSAAHLFPPKEASTSLSIIANASYLGSFATLFGIQMWVTTIHGVTLFFLLPRHTFGRIQQVFFHRYHIAGFLLNGVMLASYLIKHPYNSWEGDFLHMGYALLMGMVSQTANLFYVEGKTNKAMYDMFAIEKKNGIVDEEGKIKDGDHSQDTEYMAVKKTFDRRHVLSLMTNFVAIISSGVQLWLLTKRFQI